MEDNVINYGEVYVPKGWDDITLKTFQEIEKYYDDKERKFNLLDVIDIVIDKDRDFIMNLPTEFLDIILEKLEFLKDKPVIDKPNNKIKIGNDEYIINIQNKLKTGEYIAADTILKDDSHNYAAILAILCRKEGEIYDSKFENEILEDRIKLFESQPITKIWPLVFFFLNLSAILKLPSLLSTKVEEEVNYTVQHIENLNKNGELSTRSTKQLMKKLKKLKKSIKHT